MDIAEAMETTIITKGDVTSETRAAIEEVVASVNGIGNGNEPGPIEVKPINPYEDRIFVPSEAYAGKKRAIVFYPDPRLSQVSTSVEYFGEGFDKLAADLVATAKATDAAGLSAIQVGVAARLIVVRISKSPEYVVLANPVVHRDNLAYAVADDVIVTEGCLSFPGVQEKVERINRVMVDYQDLKGEHLKMLLTVDDPATYVAAQAVQHEVEHLDGKLLLANLNIIHRDRVRQHMKQINRKCDLIYRKTGKKVSPTQAVFGYVPEA